MRLLSSHGDRNSAGEAMKIEHVDFKKRTTGFGEIAKLLVGLFLVICLLHH
jgi:hypothetical protein